MSSDGSSTPARYGFVAALVTTAPLVVSAGSTDGPRGEPPPTIERPNFTDLEDLEVVVDGGTVSLGDSALTYQRRTVTSFDDVATRGHDGIAGTIRQFLACETDMWNIGNQTFTVDLIAVGINQGDRSLVDRGVQGVDWGVGQTLDDEGVHTLERPCDGTTVEDFGGTHHTAQWLESLGRAVYLLRGSPFADDYRSQIKAYVRGWRRSPVCSWTTTTGAIGRRPGWSTRTATSSLTRPT